MKRMGPVSRVKGSKKRSSWMVPAVHAGLVLLAACEVMGASYLAAAQSIGKNSAIPKTIARIDSTVDPDGKLQSYQPGGATATGTNAFFQSLGTNGRSCFSCHRPQDGWSISAADAS